MDCFGCATCSHSQRWHLLAECGLVAWGRPPAGAPFHRYGAAQLGSTTILRICRTLNVSTVSRFRLVHRAAGDSRRQHRTVKADGPIVFGREHWPSHQIRRASAPSPWCAALKFCFETAPAGRHLPSRNCLLQLRQQSLALPLPMFGPDREQH